MTISNGRRADHAIDAMFLDRWSPRAFTSEEIGTEELMTILEAARWAPSSYNGQPWLFAYARRNTPPWARLLGLLVEDNRVWAKDAGALVYIASRNAIVPPGKDVAEPAATHSFDAGTASGYMALQANRLGWFMHGMIGFDRDRARKELALPKNCSLEAAFAIGRRGDPARLPEKLQAREHPSNRKPLADLAHEGRFAT